MKFIVSLDRTTDGNWVADCPTISGCKSTGPTKDEAMNRVEERIRDIVRERSGPDMPLTLEVVEEQEDDWQPPRASSPES